jgi:hypothetical protein
MRWLTEDAALICKHVLGRVSIAASQRWVTIASRRVLVDPDPEGKGIQGCPNIGPAIVPCKITLKVQKGYSQWIKIGGNFVCLDTVRGFTNGTPPGVVEYTVRDPGQTFVKESA